MIEVVIKNYLDGHLSVPSFLSREDEMPEKYVIFERTSGTESNYAQSATFAFQSYGSSLYEALLLNEEVKKVIKNMIELSEISGIHLNADYNFTDTETKEYRYQAVFDINYF